MTIDEYLSRNKNTSSSFAASNAASKLVNSATNANAAKQEQLAARQAQSKPTQTAYAGMSNSQAAQAAREAELARQRAAEQQSSAYQAAQAKAQQAIQTARAQAQKQSEAILAQARARLAEQQAARVRAQAAQQYSIPSIGAGLDAYKYDNQAAAARKQLEEQRKAQADQAKQLSASKQKAEQLYLRKALKSKSDDDNYDPLANGPYIVDPLNWGYGMDTDPHTGLPLTPDPSKTPSPHGLLGTSIPKSGEPVIKPSDVDVALGSKNVPTRTLTEEQENMARNIYNNIMNNGGSADQAAKAVENTFGIKGYTVSDNAYKYDPNMHMTDDLGNGQPKDTDLSGYGRGRGGDFDLSSLLGDWIYYMPDVDNWLADSRADYGIGDYGWALGQLEDYFGKALGDLRSYGDRVLNSASDNNANARKNLLSMLRNNRASALTSGANLGAELSNNLQSVQTQSESANNANTELQQSIYKLIAEFMQNRAGLPSQATNMLAPYYEADSNVRANYLYGNAASINDAAAALVAAKLYA